MFPSVNYHQVVFGCLCLACVADCFYGHKLLLGLMGAGIEDCRSVGEYRGMKGLHHHDRYRCVSVCPFYVHISTTVR